MNRIRRFPLAPLAVLFHTSTGTGLAAAIGVDRGTIARWRRRGIPWWEADEAAVRAGLHPVNVWADWYHGDMGSR